MVYRQIPGFGVGALQVLINGPLAYRRKGLRTSAGQRSSGVGVNRQEWDVAHTTVDTSVDKADHSVVRRVLNCIKCYVAEITFVAHAKTTAQSGFAIAEHIPGKTYSWTEVVVLGIPEYAAISRE